MRIKRNLRIKSVFLLFYYCFILSCNYNLFGASKKDYKVLIGLLPNGIDKCQGYNELVIDADFFSKKEIDILHKNNNVTIFSYLNIGSLETFRSDYEEFKYLTLGEYENWSEEKWINTGDIDWQKRIIDKAGILLEKNIDGFFLDNADVYYYYNTDEIYNGLLHIITCLSKLGKPIIINGGDIFIKAAIEKNDLKDMIYGINQECVFTEIDFIKKTFSVKNKEESTYFQNYLRMCKSYGLKVYLLEYGSNKNIETVIRKYCNEHGFVYDISPSLELNIP